MKYKIREYLIHTSLNLGQAFRDLRFFYYHPRVDKIAEVGSTKHYLYSFFYRIKSLWDNIYYSIIPPHWHHSSEELKKMRTGSILQWFIHGYAPWVHPDPIYKKIYN